MPGTTTTKSANARQSSGVSHSTETKADKVVKLLRRKNGATNVDLQKATGWQAHSIRGFLSGTVKKRMGLDVESELDAKGTRRYRLVMGKASQ